MRFFSQFPLTDYKINGESTTSSLIDIYRHVDVNETLIDDLTSYRFYNIKDGERPDIVSYKLYGSPEYHWSFFVINEKLNNMNDWPRSYQEQSTYIDRKYDEYSVLEFLPNQEILENIYPAQAIPSVVNVSDVQYGNGTYTRIDNGTYDEPRWLLSKTNGEKVMIYINKYDPNDEQSYAWTIKERTPNLVTNEANETFIIAPKTSLNEVLTQKFWRLIDWTDEAGTILETQPTFTFGDEIIKYHNYFGNIDFNDPNIKLKVKNTTHEADTVAYDSERLQLWVKNISNNSFLSNDEVTYVLDYDTNITSERETWLNDIILPWLQENHFDQYSNLINDERILIDNILPYMRGSINQVTQDITFNISEITEDTVVPDTGIIDGGNFVRGSVADFQSNSIIDLLYSEYLGTIEFKTSRSWLKSYNAPYNYFDSDDNEICAYDALTADPDNDNYITYFSAEEEENESKKNIRVLKGSDVEAFADYYKELINE